MTRFAIRITPEWAALGLGVLVAAGIYAGLIHPSLRAVAAMDDARAQRDVSNKSLLDAGKQHQTLLTTIAEQKQQLEKLGGSPPSLNEKEAQLARIAAIARQCRVTLDQYQPIGDVDTREYSAVYMQFTARGTFRQLCDFFHRVESKVDYVDMTHFTLTSSVTRETDAEPTCLVTWSCKLSGMPRKPGDSERPTASRTLTAEVALHDK